MSLLLLFNQPAVVPGAEWNPEINLPEEDRRVITPEEFRGGLIEMPVDVRLIAYLDAHPEALHSLTPREFEELTAQLLEQFGYSTRLTPPGRDGGVDVFAERVSEAGQELLIVQCKRNAPENKVGEPVVKQLYADVDLRKATRGLAVTTSTFTSVALNFIDSVRYRLGSADADRLREWIGRARAARG